MKLFTNGCSYTWGAGILENHYNIDRDHLGREDISDFNKLNILKQKHTWTHHLHNKLNTEAYYNLSFGAGSNQRIVRTTLDFFTSKIENNESLDDFIAVIQWTEPSRYEIWDDELKKYLLITWSSITPPVNDIRKNLLMNRFSEHQKNFYEEWYRYLICLHSFFRLHNIKYVFCTMYQMSTTAQYILQNATWLSGNLSDSSLKEHLLPEHMYPCKHPNLLGHEIIAERIYKRLQELYNL